MNRRMAALLTTIATSACGADLTWHSEAQDRDALARARGAVLPENAEPRFLVVRAALLPRVLLFDAAGHGVVTDTVPLPRGRPCALVLHADGAVQVDLQELGIRRFLPAGLSGAFGVALDRPVPMRIQGADYAVEVALRPE